MRLQVLGVTKRYPGVVALDQVSLAVDAGEVLAVIGENGAGKSTLMKVLAGVVAPDDGQIQYEGRSVTLRSPGEAIQLGISLIHQELNLHENLTVAENIYLGREPSAWGMLKRGEMNDLAESFTRQVGLKVSPQTPLAELSTASRQLVEIAKAISTEASVVIMDEPTSSLSTQETERLFDVVGTLKGTGVSVLYISHRLAEVERLADRVEVLRDGKNSGSLTKDQIGHDAMVSAMVGRDLSQLYQRSSADQPTRAAEVIPTLQVENLRVTENAQPVSFEVHSGEIVGVAGLVGSGRTELLESIFGIRHRGAETGSGRILVDGNLVKPNDVVAAMDAGLALVPEDRKLTGLLVESSVSCNATIAAMVDHDSYPWIDRSWQSASTEELIERLAIKTASHQTTVRNLSGGNQQKIALAKWLLRQPKVLLMDEPTRGVDIGAKQEIYRLLDRLATEGLAILFVSSEMEEVIALSDRVLVMHDGSVTVELCSPEIDEETIMRYSVGASEEAAV